MVYYTYHNIFQIDIVFNALKIYVYEEEQMKHRKANYPSSKSKKWQTIIPLQFNDDQLKILIRGLTFMYI